MSSLVDTETPTKRKKLTYDDQAGAMIHAATALRTGLKEWERTGPGTEDTYN